MLFALTAVTALAVGHAQTAAPAPIAVMSSFGHSVLANNGKPVYLQRQ